MPSEQYKALMSALPGGNVDASDPIPVVREKMHAIHPKAASPGTLVEPADLNGIEAKWIATPENAKSERIVMHVHGGAFVSTVVDHYLMYGENLSRHLEARVVCFGAGRSAVSGPDSCYTERCLTCASFRQSVVVIRRLELR